MSIVIQLLGVGTGDEGNLTAGAVRSPLANLQGNIPCEWEVIPLMVEPMLEGI